jgi:hypothetical protein
VIVPLDKTHRIAGTPACWELQRLVRRKRSLAQRAEGATTAE